MVCGRCRVEFCRVCLHEWKAHGNMLKCPSEAVTTSTYELNNSRTVSMRQFFNDLALKHHEKRIAPPANKHGLLTVAKRMARRKRKTRRVSRKTVESTNLCDPFYGCENEMKLLTKSFSFIDEARFIFEYFAVLLSHCTLRQVG